MKPATASLPSRLADLVGSENILIEQKLLQAYAVDGVEPSVVVRPQTADEIAEILVFASAENLAVMPMGGRTKLGIGMPPRRYDIAMDLTRMDQVLAFEPGDLTLEVQPGIRFTALQDTLAARKQFLPLAPSVGDSATIGGIVAAGADSPLRYGYGSVRDQLLGMEFVTGAGRISKSGGRVVKNVTGYDTHQVLVGSLGTLAVITRLNFRTLPIPPEQRIFSIQFKSDRAALNFCRAVRKSQLQPRMMEILSPVTAELLGLGAAQAFWGVVVGVAGNSAVCLRHEADLTRFANESEGLHFAVLDGTERDHFFETVREFPAHVLENNRSAVIFRIPVLPSGMPELFTEISRIPEAQNMRIAVLVRAAGIVCAALLPTKQNQSLVDACKQLMGRTIQLGLRPMIECCPPDLKREINIWPPVGSDQKIAEKLKKVFDPHAALAPGRFQGGL
jgi:glycolate oxidase FAD binding subunit